jgi:hypothetical protein
MSVRVSRALMTLLVVAAGAAGVAAQQSRCADCHFANLQPSFARHLRDWDLSVHARVGVTCDRCHGGDPSTFERVLAHRGIMHWSNPASPVHRANIPRTCGGCHAGPFAAFQKSRHFGLLTSGDPNVPTCVTCHGDAGENRPSPKVLESRCLTCHRADRAGGHPEHPALGRMMLEGVRETRTLLNEARRAIARVKEPARRARLEMAAQQVDVPLTQATEAGHAFVYAGLEERLDTARQRLGALLDELANPSGR